jgi:hypothetical protein
MILGGKEVCTQVADVEVNIKLNTDEEVLDRALKEDDYTITPTGGFKVTTGDVPTEVRLHRTF